MSSNPPSIDELRKSFNRVYHGPDRLQQEYELVMESERLGVPLDTYRRLYELRGEIHIEPYPKPKKWSHTPGDWSKWVWYLTHKKKLVLARKGVVKLVQSGVILTIVIGIGRYVWEAPNREKQRHYQAWQIINLAAGQKTSGGRIEALQDLNKDRVILTGLDANSANLMFIKLQNAYLLEANLSNTDLSFAKLNSAYLHKANLSNARFYGANLEKADLNEAVFLEAELFNANLSGTNLSNANFEKANLIKVNLSNANLEKANLEKAVLLEAELFNANLSNTNLTAANLTAANLSNVNLSGTNLSNAYFFCRPTLDYCTNFKGAINITPEQIKKANFWDYACYDTEFRKKLGLPPENPKCAGEEPTK
jgi:uncharacterized protein YjbI with pentapeptide repeats